jgi:hypothetical protein
MARRSRCSRTVHLRRQHLVGTGRERLQHQLVAFPRRQDDDGYDGSEGVVLQCLADGPRVHSADAVDADARGKAAVHQGQYLAGRGALDDVERALGGKGAEHIRRPLITRRVVDESVS